MNKADDLTKRVQEWSYYLDWLGKQPLPKKEEKTPLEQASDQLKAAEEKISGLESKVRRRGWGGWSSGSTVYSDDGGMF